MNFGERSDVMRKRLGTILGGLLALATGVAGAEGAETRPPNILVIVADDLGYGELSCQGNPEIPTPNIDSIASNGIRFTNGYVSGPYCSPTRAGLLTGRYQQRFGHEFNPGPAGEEAENFGLSLKERTLADRLKSAGYKTGMFGKWHLGYRPQFQPTRRGFDEYYGFLGGAHSYVEALTEGPNPILRGTSKVEKVDYITDEFGREAVAFLEKHRQEPWFVYLPFNAVHAPLQAPEKYLSRFASIKDPKRKTFAAMLSAMDDNVGLVLNKLREQKLEEETLIIFVSDNGGPTPSTTSGNGPLHGFKAQVWEGGIRVPFLTQWKGHFPAGKTYDHPVIQLDIVPTVLAAVGVPVSDDANLDGVNLIPHLTGQKSEPPHEALFWRFGPQRAVRKGDWKLTHFDGAPKLFNLASDLGEKNDLASQHPEKLAELEADYKAWDAHNIPASWERGNRAVRAAKRAPEVPQQ